MGAIISIFPEPIIHDDTGVANKGIVTKPLDKGQVFSAQTQIGQAITNAKFTSVKVHAFSSGGTGNIKLKYTLTHIDTDADPATPTKAESSSFETITPTATSGQRFSFSLPASILSGFSGMDKTDIIGIGIQRGLAADGDTYSTLLDILQIDFELDKEAAAATDYDLVSLTVVKEYLKIGDTNADTFLQRWISLVSRAVEEYTGKKIAAQTVSGEILSGDGTRFLRTRYWPILRLDGTTDAQKLANLQYRDDPDSAWTDIETDIDHVFIYPDEPWQIELYDEIFPWGYRNIKVSYVAGYTTVPEPLQRLCVEQVAMVWKEANKSGIFRLGESSESDSVGGVAHTKNFLDLGARWKTVLDSYRSLYG
jgi:hypothetical protein